MNLLFKKVVDEKRKPAEKTQNQFAADRDSYIRDIVAWGRFPDRLCDEAVKAWPEIRKTIVESGVEQPMMGHVGPAVLEWVMSHLSDEERYEHQIMIRNLLEAIYRKLYPRVTS